MKNPELKLPEDWSAKVDEYKPLILAAARVLLVVAGVGGGANIMVGKVEQDARVEDTRAKALEADERVEWLRRGVLQRIDVEEREREEDVQKLRERIARLETLIEELRRNR